MGIVTADDALVDAALSEIVSLPVARRIALDPGRDVTYLLAQHALAQVRPHLFGVALGADADGAQGDLEGARTVYRDALAADPGSAVLRRQLAALTLQCGDAAGALALVRAGAADETLEETREAAGLHAVAASVAAAGNTPETVRLAQRAVMLTPWAAQNWEALAFVRSQPAVEPPPVDHDGASPGATVPE
jgi:superkiller protein 3